MITDSYDIETEPIISLQDFYYVRLLRKFG